MTAFSTKISFVPRDSGVKSVSFDGVDYGLNSSGTLKDLIEKLNTKIEQLQFRKISDYYIDFVSTLNWEEFLEFHQKFSRKDFSNEDINSFMTNYNDEIRYNWVVIEIYEWESYLG